MNHESYSDSALAGILLRSRRIAVVGASPNPGRPSHTVMKYLQDQGYRVIPINPAAVGTRILGQPVYPDLAALPEPVDLIDIFRNSEAAAAVIDQAIALKDRLGIKVIWLQLGVHNPAAVARAEAAGLQVVVNRCTELEHHRLRIPAG